MTNPFLSSRRNRILTGLLLGIFSLGLILQALLSCIFFIAKHKIINYLNEAIGYRLEITDISFNLFKGAHLKGVSLFYPNRNEPALYLKNAFVSVKLIPLLTKKVCVKIKIDESRLIAKKEKEGVNLQVILSDAYKRMSKDKPRLLKADINSLHIYALSSKLTWSEEEYPWKGVSVFFKNSNILILESGQTSFKSNIRIRCDILRGSFALRFLDTIAITQDLKCAMQGVFINKDFFVEMITLGLDRKEEIIGTGTIKDCIERNPYVNITFMPSLVSANKITFLKDNFMPSGYFFMSLKLSGLMDDIKPFASIHMDGCDFEYLSQDQKVIALEGARGDIEYENGAVKIENLYLRLNGIPLNIKFTANISANPDIYLSLILSKEFIARQGLAIKGLECILKGRMEHKFKGSLRIKTTHEKRGRDYPIQLYFDAIEFDYYLKKEKLFSAASLEFTKDEPDKAQKLKFLDVKAVVILGKELIEARDISFNGYGGIFKGKCTISLSLPNQALMTAFLGAADIDVGKLMLDTNLTNKLVAGNMSLSLNFNNRLKDFLTVAVSIKDGIMNLEDLGGIVKLPSLKNRGFNELELNFLLSKNLIRARDLKLNSPDIIMKAYWDASGTVNGVLDLEISSTLLNESMYFKRLLELTRIEKPYIDFKFLLGGTTSGVRFMWMKTEFKERIEEALPKGYRQIIEDRLGQMIEDLSSN